MRRCALIRAGRIAITMVLLCAPASPLLAQNENETAGFQSQHLFDAGNFGENIDILNGGVNLTTQIGPKYQLNPNLSCQMEIAYTSKIWDKGEWDNSANLYRRGAFGLGSSLHFGRIYRDVAWVIYQQKGASGLPETANDWQCTWYYVSPDGNEHVLPGPYPPDRMWLTCTVPPDNGYTVDNTFSLATGFTAWNGSGTPPTLTVTTSDGTKYTFGHFIQVTGGSGPFNSTNVGGDDSPQLRNYNRDFGGWYVTRIEDTHTAGTVWINIQYDDTPGFEHMIRFITDSDGREVEFQNACEPDAATSTGCRHGSYGANAANRPAARVKTILVPAFKGDPVADRARRAQYDFDYEWKPVYNLDYPNDPTHAQPHNVLKAVNYPSNARRSGPAERYRLLFDYNDYGEIQNRTLPTGTAPTSQNVLGSGVVWYQYNDYEFMGTGTYGYSYKPSSASRQLEAKSVCIDGTCAGWRYDRIATLATNPMVVTTTDPYGNDTVYYYHASVQDNDGLLGHCEDDGWAPEWNDGLNYRVEYYQGSGTGRRLVRMETRAYEADTAACAVGSLSHKNVRVVEEVTTYLDHESRQSVVSYSEWDGFGHFQVVKETGTDIAGARTTRTEYGGTDKRRVLYQEVSDGKRLLGRTDNAYYATGDLAVSIARLNLSAGSGMPSSTVASPGDIVTAYQYDNRANVTVKEIGDQGASNQAGVWHATSAKYSILYTYNGGYLKTKTFSGFPWKAIDRERDGNTGLIYVTRDTTGLETRYFYDDLTRITEIQPQSPEYPTQVEYLSVKSTSVRQGPATMPDDFTCSGASGDFTAVCYDYDDLGRNISTRKRLHDPARTSQQITAFDVTGQPTFESEWFWTNDPICSVSLTPASCGTTYDHHDPDNPNQLDPFGRIRRTITADGKVTRNDYFGQSVRTTAYEIQGTNGAFNATTTYLRDVWGRVIKVENPPGGGTDAVYTYDLRGNLIQIDLEDKTSGQRQSRFFQYDPLNRLSSAVNPETGVIEMTGYDPLGNITEQVDAAGGRLISIYDGAARLLKKQRRDERDPSTLITLKENVYDEGGALGINCTAGGGFGCSGGRLTTSSDYDDAGAPVLTQVARYTGLNGRIGTLTPTFATAAVGSLSYDYDYFGQQIHLSYPEGPSGRGYALTVKSKYVNGYLTQVYDGATLGSYGVVQYSPAGRPQTVTTYGNVSTNVTPDVRNRPSKITIGKGTYQPATDTFSDGTFYKSDAYQYDGAGNIAAIGQSAYAYDAANRLVRAIELAYGDSIQRQHTYAYDDFGNMTSDVYNDGGIEQAETFTMSAALDNRVGSHTSKITDLVASKILSNTTRTFLYDLRGNLTVGDSQAYVYDSRSRMTALRQITGNQEVTRYAYNADSQRVRKEDAARGVVTYYVRDQDGRILSEFRRARAGIGTPEWVKHYIYLGDRLVAMQENQVPGPVGGLSATTAAGAGVTLSWKANPVAEKVTSYKVYRFIYPSTYPSWSLVATVSAPATTLTDTSVTDFTWYEYVVAAVAGLEGYGSDPLIVQAAGTGVPQAPTGLVPLAGDRRVDLTWNAPNAAADFVIGYRIYKNGGMSPLNSTLVTAMTFADLDLPNGTACSYVVKAVNAWGKESGPSASVSATPRDYGRPGPPRNVSAVFDCTSAAPQIKVRWTAPNGATDVSSYRLYRSPDFPTSDCPTSSCKNVGNVTTYPDSSVSFGTDYRYWVEAVDLAGNVSARSIAVVASPRNVSAAVTVPSAPVVTAGDGRVTVRLTFPFGTPYPNMRVYRRPNAVQDCEAYQLVQTVPTAGGALCPQGAPCFKDIIETGVPNAVAYDYVVTNVEAAAAGGRESGFSRSALAIPVPAPIAYAECIEDLRGSTYAFWKDGAQQDAGGASRNYKRLKVRVQRPGVQEYQPLTSTTASGVTGFLRGYHLYNHWTPFTMGGGDPTKLTPVAVDFNKGRCVIDSTTGCNKDSDCAASQFCDPSTAKCVTDTGSSCFYVDQTCATGQRCITWPTWHCSDSVLSSCATDGSCASNYCTDEPAMAGICSNATATRCVVNAECGAGRCLYARPIDAYLNKYADGGFNTYTSAFQVDIATGNNGCLALKAAYKVYANGKWQFVESGFSDNFTVSPNNPFVRCWTQTPQLYNYDIFPGCPASSDQPPQALKAPTVTSTAPDTLTVKWDPAGACRPSITQVCSPGCTTYDPFASFCYWPLCPTGQVCVTNPYYKWEPEITDFGDYGHCVMASPAACDALHPCASGQTCETGGIDGYHIYVTEKRQSGAAAPTFPKAHFLPNRPAATVDRNTTEYTFKGLAPYYASGTSAIPTQFSFQVATFANGGGPIEMSPASAYASPPVSTLPMAAPQSLIAAPFVSGAVSLSWLPGAAYNTAMTTLKNYQVQRSTTRGGPYTTLGTTIATTWLDSTAQFNIDYYYVVKAVSTKNDTSDASPEVVARALPASPPAEQPLRPPGRFTAQAPEPNNPTDWSRIALSWCPNDASEGVTGYRMYRSQRSGGPYTLIVPTNQDVSPLCLDGQHRCEITSPSSGTFAISNPESCTPTGRHSPCRLIDKTVVAANEFEDYINEVAKYVWYYVVTAVKRDGAGAILSESPYSLENQGWTNYCNGSHDSCGRFDPDVPPALPCNLPQSAALAVPEGAPEWEGMAEYRLIAARRKPPDGPGPSPAPSTGPQTPGPIPRMILYHLDHLGTPIVLTNNGGFVVSTHHYMPFGDERPAQPQNSTNTLQFTGQERDSESGLDYLIARYYGSSLNRFMSPDPLPGHVLEPQTLNKYIYAGNNPLRYSDPDGLDFYLKCEGETATCHDGKQGHFERDEKGNVTKEDYTVIHSENGKLVDNHGNEYTAEVDSTGVHFTKVGDPKSASSTGTWKRNSAPTDIKQTTGALQGFTFNFSTNPHWRQDARGTFTYTGSYEQAQEALGNAGFERVHGTQPGIDFKSKDKSNKDNVAHVGLEDSGKGTVHTNESRGWRHVPEFAVNAFERATRSHLGGKE